jgi:hypothetical protein
MKDLKVAEKILLDYSGDARPVERGKCQFSKGL